MRAKTTVKSKKSKAMSRKTGKKDSLLVAQNSELGNAVTIKGKVKGNRVPSRILEEQIQEAVKGGARELLVIAEGQHGIGGRIWPKGETVRIVVEGTVGQ